MSVKILGGKLKSLELKVPFGDSVRPTAVRLKRRFFDANQSWEGRSFVDLCAGTGSIGLEAWSRGADKVILVEPDSKVFGQLKQNVDFIQAKHPEEFAQRPIVLNRQALVQYLPSFWQHYQRISPEAQSELTVFFDPPYENHGLYHVIVEQFLGPNRQPYAGEICIESDVKKGMALSFWDTIERPYDKCYTSGDHYFVIYRF